jgi:hypothetical protein
MRTRLLSTLSIVAIGLGSAACNDEREPRMGALHAAAAGELSAGQVRVPHAGGVALKPMPFLSGGTLVAAMTALTEGPAQGQAAHGAAGSGGVDLGIEADTLGCSGRNPDGNARVNQDCTFRLQAETDIAFDPTNLDNLLIGQNDSRLGFNQCGIDWSIDDGERWGDLVPPFRQKINDPSRQLPTVADPNQHTILDGPGTGHTYDFASNPGVAFDSQGRAFFSAIAADLFSPASMVFATTSPVGARGSFFLNIPPFSRQFIVVEDNNPAVFHDKPFIVADRYASSPNRDNVYVTWTVFRLGCGPTGAGYCESPIYGSMSTDHGFTWSTPELVSVNNPNLCVFGGFFTGDPADAGRCNFDQGSDPEVLPNGDVVVAFINGNTPGINNQELAARCHPTGSSPQGTAHLNCEPPSKIGDDIVEGEPLCDFGRGPEPCIPGAFVRTNDFPRIAVDTDNGDLYVAWQDYRNGEFDIQLSRSDNGGAAWAPSATVNPDFGLDHYFPAVDVAELNEQGRVGVSYYRTERVPNENVPAPGSPSGIFAPCADGGVVPPGATSCEGVQQKSSDYVLAGGRFCSAPFNDEVVSPPFPPPNGIQTGFIGDYSGLVITREAQAHPTWADTRNVDPYAPRNGVLNDEDIFSDRLTLPQGRGEPHLGVIGRD